MQRRRRFSSVSICGRFKWAPALFMNFDECLSLSEEDKFQMVLQFKSVLLWNCMCNIYNMLHVPDMCPDRTFTRRFMTDPHKLALVCNMQASKQTGWLAGWLLWSTCSMCFYPVLELGSNLQFKFWILWSRKYRKRILKLIDRWGEFSCPQFKTINPSHLDPHPKRMDSSHSAEMRRKWTIGNSLSFPLVKDAP